MTRPTVARDPLVASELPLAQRIGRWAGRYHWTDLPEELQARSLWCARDYLGCVIRGNRFDEMAPALLLAQSGDIGVPGSDRRFDAQGAALVMGMAGSLLQLHDVHVPGGIHPSSPVIPAAWAASRHAGGGRDAFLSALVVGYEVIARIAATSYPHQQMAGTCPTATIGSLGAAAAAAVALGLDEEGIARALSNGTLLGPMTAFQTLRSHGNAAALHSGLAARAGVEAALLAREGWHAGPDPLEGDDVLPGWLQVIQADPARICPEQWDGTSLGAVVWKLFPACFSSHVAIEAALRLPEPVQPERISSVEIRIPAPTAVLTQKGPGAQVELYDRLMSLRWGVCRALADGGFGPQTIARITDPDIESLIERTRVVVDPALNGYLPEQLAARLVIEREGAAPVERLHVRAKLDGALDGRPNGWIHSLDPQVLQSKFDGLTAGDDDSARAVQRFLAAEDVETMAPQS